MRKYADRLNSFNATSKGLLTLPVCSQEEALCSFYNGFRIISDYCYSLLLVRIMVIQTLQNISEAISHLKREKSTSYLFVPKSFSTITQLFAFRSISS